jgi:phage-related protein
MAWTLWQYSDIVDSIFAQCDEPMQEVLLRRLDLLSEKGNQCKRPISAPLEDGIFELRAKASRKHVRLLYYFGPNNRIIFVHAFFKDQSAVSRADIDIAKRNRKNIQEGGETHGIDLTH